VALVVGLVALDIGAAQLAGQLRRGVRLAGGQLARASVFPRVLAQLVGGVSCPLGIRAAVLNAAAASF
jgi:hypothetical protein